MCRFLPGRFFRPSFRHDGSRRPAPGFEAIGELLASRGFSNRNRRSSFRFPMRGETIKHLAAWAGVDERQNPCWAKPNHAGAPDADRSLAREAVTVRAAGRLLASELLRGHAFPSLVAQWHHPIGISVTVARLRRILTGFRFPQQTQDRRLEANARHDFWQVGEQCRPRLCSDH